MLFYHWSEAVNPDACQEVHSLEIDLSKPESELWSGFTSTTRNEVNRAKKEGIEHQIWLQPDSAVLEEFVSFYREFAGERGLGSDDPVWMQDYALQGALALTRAHGPDGATLVWHSYFRGGGWVRLLQSASFFAVTGDKELRKRVGRANRYLHWVDLTQFRELGTKHFDFGGWYSGETDEKLLQINAFKEQFGGHKTRRFHSMLAVSMKGKLFLKAREHLGRNQVLLHVV